MKIRDYGGFSLFASILIVIFILWETVYSKFVIFISVGLIIVASILELICEESVGLQADYKSNEEGSLPSNNIEKSLKVVEELERDMDKKEMRAAVEKGKEDDSVKRGVTDFYFKRRDKYKK